MINAFAERGVVAFCDGHFLRCNAGCRAQLRHRTKPPHPMIIPLAAASAWTRRAHRYPEAWHDMGQRSVIIENQDGAAGLIGADQVARASPDGYIIGGFNDSIMTMVPNMLGQVPWDIIKDFEPCRWSRRWSGAWS